MGWLSDAWDGVKSIGREIAKPFETIDRELEEVLGFETGWEDLATGGFTFANKAAQSTMAQIGQELVPEIDLPGPGAAAGATTGNAGIVNPGAISEGVRRRRAGAVQGRSSNIFLGGLGGGGLGI